MLKLDRYIIIKVYFICIFAGVKMTINVKLSSTRKKELPTVFVSNVKITKAKNLNRMSTVSST